MGCSGERETIPAAPTSCLLPPPPPWQPLAPPKGPRRSLPRDGEAGGSTLTFVTGVQRKAVADKRGRVESPKGTMAWTVTGNATPSSPPPLRVTHSGKGEGRKAPAPSCPPCERQTGCASGEGLLAGRQAGRQAASGALAATMTNSRRFHRSYSLRAPKAPVLLDLAPGDGYDPLEGGEPAWGPGEDRGRRTPRKGESSGAQRGPRAPQGRWARKAASLREGKAHRRKEEGREEATGLPAATQGDAVAHSVVPSGDDGQLLLAEDWDGVGGRMQKCKKVHRALRRGWEAFVTNVYSLTLSSPARPLAAGPLPSPQVGTR
uniref:Uncharacterized protein isoform X2 n=1 Tax=Pogona vitticeps TaxID=103695 RepID=A0A6J0VD67_9SAUR